MYLPFFVSRLDAGGFMSNIETFLQKADMEIPRTPGELFEWVEYKTSTLSKTAEGKRYARSGAVLPKKNFGRKFVR